MKIQATTYTFNATAKTITFSGVVPASLESILHVANVTTGALLFQPQAGALFTGTYSSPVLTLACSTVGMADGNRLLIFVEDGAATQSVSDGGGSLTVDGPLTDAQLRATAVPVSASGLPLPSGAATSAAQTTGNSSLSSIDGKMPTLVSGRQPVVSNVTLGGGANDATTQRVTLATDGPGVTALNNIDSDIGAPGDAAATSDSGTFGIIALIKRLAGHVMALRPITVTGTITAIDEVVTLTLSGQSAGCIYIAGTWTGTLSYETLSESGWVSMSTAPLSISTGNLMSAATAANTNRSFSCAGHQAVRVYGTTFSSGTATVTIRATTGSNIIGAVLQGTSQVVGAGARAAAITGNPVLVAVRGATAAPTVVTNGQAVDPLADTYGRLIVRPWSIPELTWSYSSASGGITTTSVTPLAGTAGAGLRRHLTGLTLSNNSATATEVEVRDGSTAIRRFHLPANAPNVAIVISSPIFTTANAALNVVCVSSGAAVYVNASGFTAP